MPQIYPLGVPQYGVDPTNGKLIELPGLQLSAATLGELLLELEKATGAWVVPDTESPKYFRYYANRKATEWEVVDIHVLRRDEEVCLKQDLGFPLLPHDRVVPGPLAC
jgi:hypothetical protein